uniref:Uncharacterized protein n=1 Tax=Anguilla anguilla TaxID=7936 RepID=A0A0E9SAQ8_ANGAN
MRSPSQTGGGADLVDPVEAGAQRTRRRAPDCSWCWV